MNHISFDANYYRSYKDRNDIKTGLVLNHIGPVKSVLDIGCNSGYMSEALLKSGKAEICHGVELCRGIITSYLFDNPRFKFFERDITDFEITQNYDAVLYMAVHHHVFGKYGKDVALRLWEKIISRCRGVLFFETGMLTGQGDLYWRDEMAKHYHSDKEHLDELFSLAGNRITSVEVLAMLSMNGVDRPIYKITLKGMKCALLAEHYGFARRTLFPMFDAWAKSRGIEIFPGTLNLRSEKRLNLPAEYINLLRWDDLLKPHPIKQKVGYSPRLYPVRINGLEAWLFRWSDDAHLENIVGDRPACPRELFCEVISRHNLKERLQIKDLDEVELIL